LLASRSGTHNIGNILFFFSNSIAIVFRPISHAKKKKEKTNVMVPIT